jgi:hypothetical protein
LSVVRYQNTQSTQQRVKYGTLHVCLNPIVGAPKSTAACQPLEARTTNSISPEPCGEASSTIGTSGDISLPHPSPHGVIKSARPPAVCFHLARGARGTLRQDEEPRGPPTTALATIDGLDVTMHSQ